MEYRTQAFAPALASAVALFGKLNEAGVRYGIFKSSRNTLAALAGTQDLDLLVAREDYGRFSAIAAGCGGIRSVNHSSLVSPGREDWFIPDLEQSRYLHLDVHTVLSLGGKFNKRYPWVAYHDIRRWNMAAFGDCLVPVASPPDEAAVTLSRIAFRSGGKGSGRWQRLSGDWAQEIDELLFDARETGEKEVRCERAGVKFRFRVRKRGNEIKAHRADLANLRRLVRARCGAPVHSVFTDPTVNLVRAWRYAASRAMNRIFPGCAMDRRRPAAGGLVVAVVAPDGMGKTTQVERMWKLFGWKFSCAALYLGTGDGQGWRLRRLLRALYMRRRARIRAMLLNESGTGRDPRSRAGAFLLSLWGVLVALERHRHVQAARRMANRGFIVFCDRWPQAIQPGLMDGPTPARATGSATWLRKWELHLYDRMARVQPDLVIQLVGDYAVSAARKPGELTREEFEKRLAVMKQARAGAPRTHVIDAGGDIDDVSRSVFGLIWKAL